MNDTLLNSTTYLIDGDFDVLSPIFHPHPHLMMGSDHRNTTFMMSHFGFFIVNVINAFVLIFFEGFGTGRLRSNRASQFSLAAHLSQLLSCFTSIRRYNVNIEFGLDAKIGTIAGIAGFLFINLSYLHLHYRNGADDIRKGVVFWTVVCGVVIITTLADWDAVHFDNFRKLIAFSAASNIYILLKSRRDLLLGMFSNELVPSAVVARIWISSVILLGISFACAFSLIPALTYPGTGIIYSVCMVNSMLTGRMSFAKDTYGASVEPEERKSILFSNDNQNCDYGCDEKGVELAQSRNLAATDFLVQRSDSDGSTASTGSSSVSLTEAHLPSFYGEEEDLDEPVMIQTV